MKRDLKSFSDRTFDLLIIGGGIYGACTAWEAALRGLSVGLIERHDFAGATSAHSQKIIHGGFRYLQHADFKRMRESIRERKNLMRIAPHLVHPLPVLIPTYGHGLRSKNILSWALKIYDQVSWDRNKGMKDSQKNIPPGHVLSKKQVLELFENFPHTELTGAGVFYDGQIYNSERLVFSFLHSAEDQGVDLANYVQAIDFIRTKETIKGVLAKDLLSGDEFPIQAKLVLNTSGPWVYQVLGLLNFSQFQKQIPWIKCFNVIVPKLFQDYAVGLYGQNKYQDRDAVLNKGARLFFVIPWRDYSIVGTSLSYFTGNPDNLKVTESEIHAFLDDFNLACPGASLQLKNVSFIHQGFLPTEGHAEKIADPQISKKYKILDHRKDGLQGLISVIGVKYTTARDVAQKTIDHVFEHLGKKSPESVSAITPIYGGNIENFNSFLKNAFKHCSDGISENAMRSLILNWGSAYPEVLKLCDPSHPIHDDTLIRAQVLYGVREEMARKLSDIILRRTELGTAGYPGDDVLAACAQTMGRELKWTSEKMQDEMEEVKKIYKVNGSFL